ncbi:MAG: hypothetical protein U9N59_04270 [Campylobacterota bacterium]|nr:hypothetical protein [Campylobacterota bacterium]
MSNKKTIYFHIGTHKTGTTALQKYFVTNREILKEKNIHYDWYHEIEHNQGFLINQDSWDTITFDCNKNYLISSEDFYHKILQISDTVKEKLNCFNIKFIIYFKRQDLMKQSVYNQIVKGSDFYKSIQEDNHYNYDYYGFLKQLEKHFPSAGIVVKAYEKEQFKDGSIFADFFDILDLELTDEYKIEKGVVNPSLTRDKLEIVRYINQLDLPMILKKNIKGLIVKSEIDTNNVSIFREQNLLSPDESKQFLESYKNGNRLIAKEYLNREDENLFYETIENNKEWKPYEGLTKEVAIHILQSIHKINQDVINQLINFIINKNTRTKVFVEATNFIMPLLIQITNKNIKFSPYKVDEMKVNNSGIFMSIKTELGSNFESADILREVAFTFEQTGDIETAYKIMKQAHALRQEGPVIEQKFEEYKKILREKRKEKELS